LVKAVCLSITPFGNLLKTTSGHLTILTYPNLDFPASTISPHLFKKVAVPGICAD
jgi:hypothetical protein